MIDIDNWTSLVLEKLKSRFDKNLIFVGLQGSYKRGEATEDSDIDLVVILNELSFKDLKTYRSILNEMPNRDKSCGFISGKNEIEQWSKSDLFQFFYDTKNIYGNLENIIIPPTKKDIQQAIKVSSENLYHASVHCFVHSNNYSEDLKGLYKTSFFILQAKYFIEHEEYISKKADLLHHLEGMEKEILNSCLNKDDFSNLNDKQLENLYQILINWASSNI